MVNFRKYTRVRGLLLTVSFTRLNAQEQRELQGRMEKKQMKEFMTVSLILVWSSSFLHTQALIVSVLLSASLIMCK